MTRNEQEMIVIKDLKKSFGDLHVLKGVNLTIAEKEVVVIIGPSGSGKSTLLRCHQLFGGAYWRQHCYRRYSAER